MVTLNMKRGDTFRYRAQATVSDGLIPPAQIPLDLTGFLIKAQVRKGTELIAELVVTRTNDILGEYMLSLADTTLWPVKTLVCDIQYTTDDLQIISTETFEIAVEKDITLP